MPKARLVLITYFALPLSFPQSNNVVLSCSMSTSFPTTTACSSISRKHLSSVSSTPHGLKKPTPSSVT
jgi:hypothetical protein